MSEDIEKAINTLRFAADNEDLKLKAINSLNDLLSECRLHFQIESPESNIFFAAKHMCVHIAKITANIEASPSDGSGEMVEHTVLFPKPDEGFAWSGTPKRVKTGDKYLDTKEMEVCVAATNYMLKALYYIQAPIKEEPKGPILEKAMSHTANKSKARSREIMLGVFKALNYSGDRLGVGDAYELVDELISASVSESFMVMSEYVNANFQRKDTDGQ